MGDFHQTESIATLHRLKKDNVDILESELLVYSKDRPIALVLPSLYSELKGDALKNIVSVLKERKYINEIVVSLDRANRKEFDHAKKFFSILPQNTKIIWNDGRRIKSLFKLLEKNGLYIGERGKGRGAWISFGFILAKNTSEVVALHDCDILTYDRELLARLCYPVANTNLDYDFCKGYYQRASNKKIYGRVMRLYISPILRALKKIVGHLPYLTYMDSFRYPLAGEFSMKIGLARINRIPTHWGLEIGVLSEVYRNVNPKRVCQVDLCENYEHKHQEISSDDPDRGLLKMCLDISKTLFRALASEGVVFSDGLFKSLLAAYMRIAQDTIKMYNDDAAINCLEFDRHAEGFAVETFCKGIKLASKRYFDEPMDAPLIPNWNRVTSAIPDFLDQLKDAIEKDNE